jgi:hypothetical protein
VVTALLAIFDPVTARLRIFAVTTAFFFSCSGPTLLASSAAAAVPPRAMNSAATATTFEKVSFSRTAFRIVSWVLGPIASLPDARTR